MADFGEIMRRFDESAAKDIISKDIPSEDAELITEWFSQFSGVHALYSLFYSTDNSNLKGYISAIINTLYSLYTLNNEIELEKTLGGNSE